MADRRRVARLIVFGIVAGFVLLALVVVDRVVRHPQTDDAVVTADVIGVVPQVSGTITELHVQDNQRVKQGDLLLVVDPRPTARSRSPSGKSRASDSASRPPGRACSAWRRSSRTPRTT